MLIFSKAIKKVHMGNLNNNPTPRHPKYQNNNINNTQMRMSENYLTES